MAINKRIKSDRGGDSHQSNYRKKGKSESIARYIEPRIYILLASLGHHWIQLIRLVCGFLFFFSSSIQFDPRTTGKIVWDATTTIFFFHLAMSRLRLVNVIWFAKQQIDIDRHKRSPRRTSFLPFLFLYCRRLLFGDLKRVEGVTPLLVVKKRADKEKLDDDDDDVKEISKEYPCR